MKLNIQKIWELLRLWKSWEKHEHDLLALFTSAWTMSEVVGIFQHLLDCFLVSLPGKGKENRIYDLKFKKKTQFHSPLKCIKTWSFLQTYLFISLTANGEFLQQILLNMGKTLAELRTRVVCLKTLRKKFNTINTFFCI